VEEREEQNFGARLRGTARGRERAPENYFNRAEQPDVEEEK